MERGTERERRAVRERWTALERREALVTRLFGALALLGGGAVLLFLAAATRACDSAPGGGVTSCSPVTRPPVPSVFVFLGFVALLGGLWLCWTVFRD